MLELGVTVPFHAFFGVIVMLTPTLLGPASFAHTAHVWGIDPLADQHTAGAIAWISAEIPTLLVLAALLIQWIRADERAAARHDRRAAHDGEAELASYNAHLAALHHTSRAR